MGLTSLIWGLHLHLPVDSGAPFQLSPGLSICVWVMLQNYQALAQAELCLCLSKDPVDPDPEQQTDFPAWPQACLVTGDQPSNHCAVSSPGYLTELGSDWQWFHSKILELPYKQSVA